MKIVSVLAAASLVSGCALFSANERSASSREQSSSSPAYSPARTAVREAFRPAYAAGRPVALVPCRKRSALTDDCRAGNDLHQFANERLSEKDERPQGQSLLAPVSE